MEIKIKSKIERNEKIEQLEEVFPCRKEVRRGNTYLIYYNAQNEKVLIKFDEKELTRVERATSRTFQFVLGKITENYYDGLGWLRIKTERYKCFEHKVCLNYQLFKEETLLGNYSLELNYG